MNIYCPMNLMTHYIRLCRMIPANADETGTGPSGRLKLNMGINVELISRSDKGHELAY